MKVGLCFAFSCMGICLSQAGRDFFELPPIKSSETASDDAVVRLAGEIERGDWVVACDFPDIGGPWDVYSLGCA
jgi:hypothetical protein